MRGGEARGLSWVERIPIWTWLRRLAGIVFLLLFLNFSFYVFPRGGGPLKTVIVICGSCRGDNYGILYWRESSGAG